MQIPVSHKFACGAKSEYVNTPESRAAFDVTFKQHRFTCKACRAKQSGPSATFGEPNIIQFAPFDVRPFPPQFKGQMAE